MDEENAAENVGDPVARDCLPETSFAHVAKMATELGPRERIGGLWATSIADAAASHRKAKALKGAPP